MTADALRQVRLPGKTVELVQGRLVVREPPGTWHGRIAARLAYLLGAFVYDKRLGALFGQDTGFRIAIDPDTVRAPDVAFVAAARVHLIEREGYATLAPDLVVEIVSPDDRPGELLAKVGEWIAAGVRVVWVIDPARRHAHVYRADGTLRVVFGDAALDGDQVLPGFLCPLSMVFD